MRRDLEQTRAFFKDDRFAVYNGITIDEVGEGYAKCSMEIDENHLNARSNVMGGAIFTLADLCFGAASDGEAVSMSSEINFISPGRGPKLNAEARLIHGGNTTVLYEVEVTEGDRKVAFVTMRGFKVAKSS
jgi:acyl-CoA thioesterase